MSARDLPKLRLIKERQATGPASLSIRFNAASMRDDDDDDGGIVLPSPSPEEPTSPKVPSEQTPSTSTNGRDTDSASDKSMRSEIKERPPEQITAVTDLMDGNVSDKELNPKNNSQDKIKPDEAEITDSLRQKQSGSESIDDGDVFLPPVSPLPPRSFNGDDRSIEEDTRSIDSTDSKGKSRRLSPLRRFRNKSAEGKDSSGSSSPLKRFRNKPEVKESPVSMSTLLNNSREDEESVLLADDEEEFFDPNEESISTLPTPEPSSDADKQSADTVEEGSLAAMHLVGSKSAILLTVVLACLFAPLPPYLAGLILGCILGALVMVVYQWVTVPPLPKPVFELMPLDKLGPLQVPEMRESANEQGKFKGWLNELSHYDPEDYHISSSRTVFVQLEGSDLRLQTPKIPVPKRAMWNEPMLHQSSFIHQRFIDLTSARVYLLPEGLVKKRLWSKKYPICIELSIKPGEKLPSKPSQTLHSSLEDLRTTLDKDRDRGSEIETTAKDLNYEVVQRSNKDGKLLYLFARTCREKEEWYRRFYAASRGTPLPSQMVGLLTKLYEQKSSSQSNRLASLSSEKDPQTSVLPTPEPPVTPIPHSMTDSNLPAVAAAAAAAGGIGTPGTLTPSSGTPQISCSLPTFGIPPGIEPSPDELFVQYLRYMSRLMPADSLDRFLASAGPNLSRRVFQLEQGISSGGQSKCDENLIWFNALLGRLFWDFLREKYWSDMVKEKIQRKLSKIHVPFFIDELTVTGIELGKEIPLIRRITRPYIDDRGLWFDLDIAYGGGFTMSLETKVNLMKLKKVNEGTVPQDGMSTPLDSISLTSEERKNAATNSEEEDSAESSTDEELEDAVQEQSFEADPRSHATSTNTSKKLLRLVDKIAASRYFQQATEYKYIKKAMEEVSNTRLMLTVELKSVVGVLAVNIPPPPTDRIWYGFRTNPNLYLSAKPQVGERTITVSHITDWIEKKLAIEFQRVFVFPNMDDLLIPLMCDEQTGQDRASTTNSSASPQPSAQSSAQNAPSVFSSTPSQDYIYVAKRAEKTPSTQTSREAT